MTLEEKLFYPSPPSSPVPTFKSSTLILPSISIGNVPQLAIDLLITTLKIPLVGYMTSPYLVPCAGTREESTPFGNGGIACPIEGILLLMINVDGCVKCTLMQRRSWLLFNNEVHLFHIRWRLLLCRIYGSLFLVMDLVKLSCWQVQMQHVVQTNKSLGIFPPLPV